jgi:glycosyltransferase involved in cell wall biosynthesis
VAVKRQVVLVTGPQRDAISGISTHLNQLFASRLAAEYLLAQFQVGSQGRRESGTGRLLRVLASPFLLAAEIFRSGVVLVHVNTSMNARAFWRDLSYLLVAKACGTRVVLQVHGGALPQDFLGRGRLRHACLRSLLTLPDAIVVLARGELEAYRNFLPGRQVLALPNGIDSSALEKLPRSFADSREQLRLAYIGRLVRTKGLYELLQGLHLALAAGAHARLVIAGSGPEERRLRQFAAQLGVAGAVEFAGLVEGKCKEELLAASDVLVLASYAEGLPYALLESMAAGTPPIATRVGAIPDVVTQGVHGLLIAPHDANAICRAITTLAADRELLQRMSNAGRLRVATTYSVERLAGDFCRLYAALCAPGPAGELTGS